MDAFASEWKSECHSWPFRFCFAPLEVVLKTWCGMEYWGPRSCCTERIKTWSRKCCWRWGISMSFWCQNWNTWLHLLQILWFWGFWHGDSSCWLGCFPCLLDAMYLLYLCGSWKWFFLVLENNLYSQPIIRSVIMLGSSNHPQLHVKHG